MMQGKRLFMLFIGLLATSALKHGVDSGIQPTRDLAQEREELISLLPRGGDVPGWQISSPVKFYEVNNLWEYINGQAEMYINYGFRQVATLDYEYAEGSGSLNIEIYKMESSLHAFGIYAAERSPEDSVASIGAEGYIGENSINFWKGPFYVKLTSFEESLDTKEILLKIARLISFRIKGSYSKPGRFALFPENERISMSERYIPSNFLGQPFLKNGYLINYERNGIQYSIFLAENSTPDEARKAFKKYIDFLEAGDAITSLEEKHDFRVIKVKDKRNKFLFQYGSFIGGVDNIEDFSEAEKIAEEMIGKLRSRNQA